MTRIGIFADRPDASTGFATVCRNLAKQLSSFFDLEIYYFGRFGLKELGYPRKAQLNEDGYYYVPCMGGVWDNNYVRKLIEKWNIDIVFSEDDWFSGHGLLVACRQTNKPFHFLTPIDCLPVTKSAIKMLSQVTKVYVPNSSYKVLQDQNINAEYLPHGVDGNLFFPIKRDRETITFIWIGRDEPRKALGRMLQAFKLILEETKFPVDLKLLVRTDWKHSNSNFFVEKFMKRNVIMDQMENVPHSQINYVYNRGDVFICTSKAGGFEMGITEANASGIPALVTNHPFMNEIVRNGVNGWHVDLAGFEETENQTQWGLISIEDLAAKIMFCIQNIDSIRTSINRIRQYAVTTYDWKKIAKALYIGLTDS